MTEFIAGILSFLVYHRLLVAIFVGAYILTSVILTETWFYEFGLNMLLVLFLFIVIPYISFAIFYILGGVA